jgi:hypothetical protein
LSDRVLVVSSAAPEHAPFTDLTWATQRKWCERHGYDYVTDVSNVADKDQPTHFGQQPLGYLPIRGFVKLDLLLHYLDPHSCRKEYDIVCWLDSDLVVSNYDIPLSRWMNTTEHLLLCYDINGHNSTVIGARNTDLVFDLMLAANTIGRKYFLRDAWMEMNALRFFLQTPPYAGMVNYVSVKELCAIPPEIYGIPRRSVEKYEWASGDFACHFSAMGTEERARFARAFVEANGLL